MGMTIKNIVENIQNKKIINNNINNNVNIINELNALPDINSHHHNIAHTTRKENNNNHYPTIINQNRNNIISANILNENIFKKRKVSDLRVNSHDDHYIEHNKLNANIIQNKKWGSYAAMYKNSEDNAHNNNYNNTNNNYTNFNRAVSKPLPVKSKNYSKDIFFKMFYF
jgi:hypothetical protein